MPDVDWTVDRCRDLLKVIEDCVMNDKEYYVCFNNGELKCEEIANDWIS
jgi:hypothetical protein